MDGVESTLRERHGETALLHEVDGDLLSALLAITVGNRGAEHLSLNIITRDGTGKSHQLDLIHSLLNNDLLEILKRGLKVSLIGTDGLPGSNVARNILISDDLTRLGNGELSLRNGLVTNESVDGVLGELLDGTVLGNSLVGTLGLDDAVDVLEDLS